MQRSLRPSCLRTSERAAKRLSAPTRRFTKFERRVRETMKEQVEPATVAVAAMNHLMGSRY